MNNPILNSVAGINISEQWPTTPIHQKPGIQ